MFGVGVTIDVDVGKGRRSRHIEAAFSFLGNDGVVGF
jgi:hypothetical protein